MRSIKWKTIDWEVHSWKMSLNSECRVINLQRTKSSTFFSDSVLCLGKILENNQSNSAEKARLGWFERSPEYKSFDRIRVEYFPRIQYVAAQWKSQTFTVQMGRNTRNIQEELSSSRCSTTSPVDQETMTKNASRMLNSPLFLQRDL